MQKLCVLIVVGLVAVVVGCRSPINARFSDSQRESIESLKSNLRDYKCVLLVCVYEDHWEDKGPSYYALHHFKATVVRTYKGDWRVAERVAFVHGVDAPAQNTANAKVGTLMFLFTNGHTASEIGVDTGQFYGYDPEGEREMQFIFQATTANHSSHQPSRRATEPFMETWKPSLQTASCYGGPG